LADGGMRLQVCGDDRLMARLRRDYDSWWHEMRSAHAQVVAIPVGSPQENPALLSARDWQPTAGRVPWLQSWVDDPAYDANGFWCLDVVAAGAYEIELRSHPPAAGPPLGALAAELSVGATTYRQEIATEAWAARFRLELPAGRLRLQTVLRGPAPRRARGAYETVLRML